MMRFLPLSFILISFVALILSCSESSVSPALTPQEASVKLNEDEIPDFIHDTDLELLRQAIQRNLIFLNKLKNETVFYFGKDEFTVQHLKLSINHFLTIFEKHHSNPKTLKALIKKDFNVYQSVGSDNQGTVLFTGYYIPLLRGSLTKSKRYKYPVYRVPDDLIIIDLGLFKDEWKGKKLIARTENNKALPYYTHEEILNGALDNKNYEMVWVDDLVTLAFTHIQGAGVVELDNGTYIYIGYALHNGHSYKPIGKLLIDEGHINRKNISMQSIETWLKENPAQVNRVLAYNPSYIFFEQKKNMAIGNINVPLTERHSIASDYRIFPKGSLAFIATEKPFVKGNKITGWQKFGRFVMNQDTGGAIRGPGRVDIFWGKGEYAELVAGHSKQKGKLYFLVKKK